MRWLIVLFWLSAQIVTASKGPENLRIRAFLVAGIEKSVDSLYHLTEGSESLIIWLEATPRNQFRTFRYTISNDEADQAGQTDSIQIKVDKLFVGINLLEISGITRDGRQINIPPVTLLVKKTWYRSTWFWALCLFMLLGAFFGSERFLKKFEEDDELKQKRIAGLELRTLQLQMNPHFVFNALNSIQSFVIDKDTLMANDYLSKFARLIRMFLDSSRARFITIEEEAELLQLYCEMEKLRFESKFDFEIHIMDDLDKSLEIPTMILQPFLENAINHGLRYKSSRGFLKVEFIDKGASIICRVADNGIGRERASQLTKADKVGGYKSQGLLITMERIATLNKVNDSRLEFDIRNLYDPENSGDVGTLVTLTFPKHID